MHLYVFKNLGIHEGVATAISQSDCLAFDTNHANFFAENGNLGINVSLILNNTLMSENWF